MQVRRLRIAALAAVAVGAVAAVSVPAGAGGATSLDQQKATLQFQGRMFTIWSFPPTQEGDDGCYVFTKSGSGRQSMEYRTQGHVNVNIVDSGSTIAFQLVPSERAGPNHRAIGFKLADAVQEGSEKTVTHKSQLWDQSCYPDPGETFAEASSCGSYTVPWDAQPLVAGNKFMPDVSAFLLAALHGPCPLKSPTGIDVAEGAMPEMTQTHLSASTVRNVLGQKHGKLIIHGSHRWHSEDEQSGYDVTATTTVTWKATLIRAH